MQRLLHAFFSFLTFQIRISFMSLPFVRGIRETSNHFSFLPQKECIREHPKPRYFLRASVSAARRVFLYGAKASVSGSRCNLLREDNSLHQHISSESALCYHSIRNLFSDPIPNFLYRCIQHEILVKSFFFQKFLHSVKSAYIQRIMGV